jgi:hypothetical protein
VTETGWLLEQKLNGWSWWWTGTRIEGCRIWTTDASRAVRFARKEDAERTRDVLRKYGVAGMLEAIATEHMWCPPPPAAPDNQPMPGFGNWSEATARNGGW